MKSKFYLLSITLIVVMSILLGGCSNSSDKETVKEQDSKVESEESNLNDSEEKSNSNESVEEVKKEDPFGKYEEPVTITVVGGVSQPDSDKVPAGTTPENQSWVRLVKDKLNIDLKYAWTVPTEQFEQKFNLSLAAGDMPDIMSVTEQQFEKFKETGSLADLTEVYNKYMLDEIKRDIESNGDAALDAVSEDGKLYAIPGINNPYERVQLIWLREDWLKNLNLQEPKTMQDLLAIAEAFATQDPDANGENDTYGIGFNKEIFTWAYDTKGFLYGYHAYPEIWIKDGNGGLKFGTIQPEVKDGLKALQELYKKGVIDPEYAVKDHAKLAEDIIAGKIGIIFGEWWHPNWPLNANKDNQPEAEWKCYPLVSIDENDALSAIKKVQITRRNVVSKDCENVEAAIKMLNLYYDTQCNKDAKEKYEGYLGEENGFVWTWVPQVVFQSGSHNLNYEKAHEAIENNDPSVLYQPNMQKLYEQTKLYLEEGDESAWGYYYSRYAEDGGWGTTRKIQETDKVIRDEYYGPMPEVLVENGSTLKRLRDETFHAIIMGESIDKFDEYVSSWKKLGGDDITKEVNEWYKNKQ